MQQDGKPSPQDIEWQKKVPEYMKVVTLAARTLIMKDADVFMSLMDPSVVQQVGHEKFKRMVDLVFIPFFSDYQKDGQELLVCEAREENGKKGLSFYPEFVTSTGMKMHYVIIVMERNGKPMVSILLPNRSFSDDHPNVEEERRRNQQH